MAISSLTAVKYILSLFLRSPADFEYIGNADKVLAICIVWVIIAINCWSIKLNQELTKGLGYIKMISLTSIVLIGLYGVATGLCNFDIFKVENRWHVKMLIFRESIASV